MWMAPALSFDRRLRLTALFVALLCWKSQVLSESEAKATVVDNFELAHPMVVTFDFARHANVFHFVLGMQGVNVIDEKAIVSRVCDRIERARRFCELNADTADIDSDIPAVRKRSREVRKG